MPGIVEFLEKEKPDILVAQEVYNAKNNSLEDRFNSVELLKRSCNFFYDFFSPACIDVREEGKLENGNAIFSNFPIVKTNTVFFDVPFGERSGAIEGGGDYSMTPRNMQHAEIKIGEKNLNIFNTQGIWGMDGADNDRKLKMSETIISEVKDRENVILAGDFNLKPNTKTIGNIEKHLKNIFKDELRTTFNMKQKDNPGYADAVVDMVFSNSDLKVIDHYCPDVDISDHLPLVATFEV